MFEGPGSATRKHVVDSGFGLFLLAAPIFFGYAVLAPDRVGLRAARPQSRQVVGAAITPTPAVLTPAAPAPISMPSAIPSPVATPVSKPEPFVPVRPVLVPPPRSEERRVGKECRTPGAASQGQRSDDGHGAGHEEPAPQRETA